MPLAVASPIELNLWTFVFQAVNVLLVMAVLYKFLYQPISSIIAKREETIESSLQKAVSIREEAERLLAEYKGRLDQAAQEAQDVIDRANRAAEESRRQTVSEAQEEATRTLEKAKREIAAEREKALSAIRDEVATLAILAAGKAIGKALTAEDHKRLVSEFVAQVPQARSEATE